jgi:hypothetical protein
MKRIETTIAFNMATRVCGYLMEESTDWMRYILAKDRPSPSRALPGD